MIVLVDNYDSFTFNLVHYLGGLGADVVVHRNDKIAVKDVLAAEPEAIVLSPGPCTPNEAGICLDLIEQASGYGLDVAPRDGRLHVTRGAFEQRGAKPMLERLDAARECGLRDVHQLGRFVKAAQVKNREKSA